jgi:DnaK suppressor protein
LRVRIQSGIHARLIRRTGAFSGPKPIRKPANFAEEKTASSAPIGIGTGDKDNPFNGAVTMPNTDTTAVLDFKPYKPKRGEEYMNDKQVEHFQNILNGWKRQLMEEVDRTLHHMQDEAANFPDPNDRATQESEFTLELRTRDRERKLIKKIDESLATLDNGDYGFCETCGIEIGIRRLEARPTATLCIDCKVLDEIREKQMG